MSTVRLHDSARRLMRDAGTGAVRIGNKQQGYTSWLEEAINAMGNTGCIAYPLNDATEVIVLDSYPQVLSPTSPAELLRTMQQATQGSGEKRVSQATAASTPVDFTVTLTTPVKICAVRIRIQDSVLGLQMGSFPLTLRNNATAVTAVRANLLRSGEPIDFVLLNATSAGSFATIADNTAPVVAASATGGVGSWTGGSTSLLVESITARDLQALVGKF